MTTIHTHAGAIVIRHANGADARTLTDLAQLDDRAPLTGPALIAEVDGVARAALDLHDGSVAADPFARTADLVELLKLHARGTRGAANGSLRGRVASFLRPVSLRA
jgi:hypothetical protein